MKQWWMWLLAGLAIGAGAALLILGRWRIIDDSLESRGARLPRQVMLDRWTGRTWHRSFSDDWRELKRKSE